MSSLFDELGLILDLNEHVMTKEQIRKISKTQMQNMHSLIPFNISSNKSKKLFNLEYDSNKSLKMVYFILYNKLKFRIVITTELMQVYPSYKKNITTINKLLKIKMIQKALTYSSNTTTNNSEDNEHEENDNEGNDNVEEDNDNIEEDNDEYEENDNEENDNVEEDNDNVEEDNDDTKEKKRGRRQILKTIILDKIKVYDLSKHVMNDEEIENITSTQFTNMSTRASYIGTTIILSISNMTHNINLVNNLYCLNIKNAKVISDNTHILSYHWFIKIKKIIFKLKIVNDGIYIYRSNVSNTPKIRQLLRLKEIQSEIEEENKKILKIERAKEKQAREERDRV